MTAKLPPLPYPQLDSTPNFTEPGFTADQLRAYAEEAVRVAVGGEVTYQFEVWQNDECQAAGDAHSFDAAVIEAEHYAMMYGQDGPVSVRYYERRAVDAAINSEVAQG